MNYALNLAEFWKENETCFMPFSTSKPRVPINFWLDDHYLLEEMSLPSTNRYYNDHKYRIQINKLCNNKIEPVLGKRFFDEEEVESPVPNRFEVLMGSRWQLSEGGTPWLESDVESIEDVKRIIDRAIKLDMKTQAFPENWTQQKENYEKRMGKKLELGGKGSRGPATMATSILGTTNTCMFMMDEPEIMNAFFSVLASKLIEYQKVLMEDTNQKIIEGYSLTDDNCYLFPPKQYLEFCAPVLDNLFKEFAPLPEHKRFQHSDSDMGHLMGILKDLGINGVNLGPNIQPLDIRRAMPHTVISGQIPPFLLRNGTHKEIIDTVRRDIDAVGGDGGLIECPAGSVTGGTSLENLKVYMWAVDKYGRY